MSYEKVKIISPENVRNPETSYVYVGYGYSTTFDYTGLWIKDASGGISIVSGGTGGGGGTNYWAKSGSDLSTGSAFGVNLVKIVSNTPGQGGLYVDPAGTGTATSLQQMTVEGAIRLGTTAPYGDYAGSIKYTGSDFFGYITGRGWLSLTQSGGTSGTAGTNYWTPLTYGIAPNGFDKIYVGGSFSDATTDEPINSYGGITLGRKTTKPTKEGTIYYNSQGYFIGLSGTSGVDRRLDTFNVAAGDRAYYNNIVLVGRDSTIETISGHISGTIEPKFNVTGYTISDHIVSRYAIPAGVARGGFGGYSGSTLKYGITKTITLTELGSLSDAGIPPGGGGVTQIRKGIDIVNGIITKVEITDGGAPADMRLTDYGLDADAYSKTETDSLYSPKGGVFNVDTSNNKATSDDQFIIATNTDLTVDSSDTLTGKTMIVINTKASAINITATKPSEAAKSTTLSAGKLGILTFDGAKWAMAEIAFSGKTFS